MSMMSGSEKRDAVKAVIDKFQKLTAEDLRTLRECTDIMPSMTGRQADWLVMRMEIELIDAIRSLDDSSTRLVTTTNRLTAVILALTFVGVLLAGVQLWLGLMRS